MSSKFWSFDQTVLWLSQAHLGNQIGIGGYAEVYQVVSNDGSIYAVKKQFINGRNHDDAGVLANSTIEINLLRSVQHPHIIKFYGAFFQSNKLNLILECASQDLHTYISSTSARDRFAHVPRLLHSMVQAITTLDSLGFHHFDVKPKNVLVMYSPPNLEPTFKLADFGLSMSNSCYFNYQGDVYTIWYRPPEQYVPIRSSLDYQLDLLAGDIWALGLTVLEVLIIKELFKVRTATNFFEVVRKNIKHVHLFDIPLTSLQSNSLNWAKAYRQNLIRGCLNVRAIIEQNVNPDQIGLIDQDLIHLLESMLEISPIYRIKGRPLLERSKGLISASCSDDDLDWSFSSEGSSSSSDKDEFSSEEEQTPLKRLIESLNIIRLVRLVVVLGGTIEVLIQGLDILTRYQYLSQHGLVRKDFNQKYLQVTDSSKELKISPTLLKNRTKAKSSSSEENPPKPQLNDSSSLRMPQPKRTYSACCLESPSEPSPPSSSGLARVIKLRPKLSSLSIPSTQSPDHPDDLEEFLEWSDHPDNIQTIELLAIIKLAFDINHPDLIGSSNLLEIFIWTKDWLACRNDFIQSQKQVLTSLDFMLTTEFTQKLIKWSKEDQHSLNNPLTWAKLTEFSWLECFFE